MEAMNMNRAELNNEELNNVNGGADFFNVVKPFRSVPYTYTETTAADSEDSLDEEAVAKLAEYGVNNPGLTFQPGFTPFHWDGTPVNAELAV